MGVQPFYNDHHCIKVSRIYDWVNRRSQVHFKRFLLKTKKLITDEVSGDICIKKDCHKPLLLWEGNSHINITGTVTLFNKSNYRSRIDVYINNSYEFSVEQKQSRSITVEELNSLMVQSSGSETCVGEFSIILHYPIVIEELNDQFNLKEVSCFISNQYGKPVHNLNNTTSCDQHKDVEVVFPNGELRILQNVLVIKKGYLVIQLSPCQRIGPIAFSFEESFLLCAPPQTTVESDVFDIECEIIAYPSDKEDVLLEFEIGINMCQNITVNGDVKVALDCQLSQPRNDHRPVKIKKEQTH